MWILVSIALVSVILGILIIARRKDLTGLEDSLNTTVTTPSAGLKSSPVILGVFLIAFSIFLLFVAKSIMR